MSRGGEWRLQAPWWQREAAAPQPPDCLRLQMSSPTCSSRSGPGEDVRLLGISGYLVDLVAKTIDAGCKPYMAVSTAPGVALGSKKPCQEQTWVLRGSIEIRPKAQEVSCTSFFLNVSCLRIPSPFLLLYLKQEPEEEAYSEKALHKARAQFSTCAVC